MAAAPSAFAALRRLVDQRPPVEHCELCAGELARGHRHLVEVATHKLVCVCRACAVLFDGPGRFRLIPEDVQRLDDFVLTDAQWDELRLPINLAFFFHSVLAERPVAIYPSPAGGTESLLPLDAWSALVAGNPRLAELTPDVEAVLVNRMGSTRAYYLVPIDECYQLVGLLRSKWRGLSGGKEVWHAVEAFFVELDRKAHRNGVAS